MGFRFSRNLEQARESPALNTVVETTYNYRIVRLRERTRIETAIYRTLIDWRQSSACESGRGLKPIRCDPRGSDPSIVRLRERTRIETCEPFKAYDKIDIVRLRERTRIETVEWQLPEQEWVIVRLRERTRIETLKIAPRKSALLNRPLARADAD